MEKNSTLKVLGTSVTLPAAVQAQAREDLGFDIAFEVLNGVEVQQKGILRPDDYDIYDQWFHSIDLLWTAGAIQPIQSGLLDHWDEVGALTKTGTLGEDGNLGAGNRPMDIQFVQQDDALGSDPTPLISAVPTAHNADSFSYDPQLVPSGLAPETESWGWLLDPKWKGKVGLNTDPSIGIADVILAAEALDLTTFSDIGNLSIEEIDALVGELVLLKRAGHFAGFWSSVDDSVDHMLRRKGRIGGIWSPAEMELRARNVQLRVAAPKEGYRAWHSCLCLSSQMPEAKSETAYRYLNWWLSGRPGAILARQGYYTSTPERTRPYLSAAEWDFWYAGKPAREELNDPQGRRIIPKGTLRDGGSHENRMSNIKMWNTLMDEQNYLVRRWNEFLAA